jgi:O-methyltransferase/methyltransferase family protein
MTSATQLPPAVTGRPMTGPPPEVQLVMLTHGKRVSQVVYAVAALGVADQLTGAEPRPVPELAELTGTRAEPLYRLLRAAAAIGVLTEHPDRSFGLTPVGAALAADAPNSQRDMVLLNGDPALWRPYGDILHTLRTGEPAFEHVFGTSFFEYLRRSPETAATFDGAMSSIGRWTSLLLAAQADFSGFSSIVDVGGGQGSFLATVLSRTPGATGVLVDQEEVLAGAPGVLAAAGVAERVRLQPGDFFTEVPGGADAYLLKAVLHDWDDEAALRILRAVRAALGDAAERPQARLFVGEQVVGDPNSWDPAKLLDLDMMLRFGGRERTLTEWRDLLAAAGYQLVPPSGATSGWVLLEARPVP